MSQRYNIMSREESIKSLKEQLIKRAKEGRFHELSQALYYSIGYMPDLTLGEFDVLLESIKEQNIIF